jgi:signal transduction histidine kinase
MPGRRRAPQKATKRTSALAAENERLQRELEWPARSWPSETRATPPGTSIYYVVAEALTNVAKYSRARVARVRVFREDAYVVAEESEGRPTLLRATVRL